jgi:hypothetical protein
MAMDSYYTNRFDKYEDEQNIYHVLYSCPVGDAIKEKHREPGMPPAREHRLPCSACLAEIRSWLKALPEEIRPTQFGVGVGAGTGGGGGVGAEVADEAGAGGLTGAAGAENGNGDGVADGPGIGAAAVDEGDGDGEDQDGLTDEEREERTELELRVKDFFATVLESHQQSKPREDYQARWE